MPKLCYRNIPSAQPNHKNTQTSPQNEIEKKNLNFTN